MKHIHILGIGGTFMSALAILARESGFKVTGCDAQCYPPVSDLLKDKQIEWVEGYDDIGLALSADDVIIGNTIKRGTPVLEAVLSERKNFSSGPEWLEKNILSRYKVMAVSGTHGKTTTTSMLAWILSESGLNPGFLIGGVVPGFQTNAKLGEGDWFVIEADEYDSAFFDKRPKFVHYWPTVAVMNNLEFDHADIYDSLEDIKKQFFYLLRTIPKEGMVIYPIDDKNLKSLCQKQNFCHSQTVSSTSHADWEARLIEPDGSHFEVFFQQSKVCEVSWSLIGQFNVDNGLNALVAAIASRSDTFRWNI